MLEPETAEGAPAAGAFGMSRVPASGECQVVPKVMLPRKFFKMPPSLRYLSHSAREAMLHETAETKIYSARMLSCL